MGVVPALLMAFALPCIGAEPGETPKLLKAAKKIYERQCIACHGETGEGDGIAAYLLSPKPRNFGNGKFNRRNTPPKNLPAGQDLFTAISEGLLGSSMPPWKDYLTKEERWGLVYYLKKNLIAMRDEDTGEIFTLYEFDPPKPPLTVPAEIPATPENIAIGEGAYQSVSECWTCHGRSGRGDGPKSQEIVNALGERIYPIDLGKGIYKLSSNNEEIFRRIRDGITLAPMYSMSKTLTDDEVWCLVHYVRSLVSRTDEERRKNEQRRISIHVVRVDGDLPKGSDDKEWNIIPSTYVPLMPLWWRAERIEGCFVKAVHNGKEISIRLSWVDDTRNISAIRHQEFRDGAAIQFSTEKDPPFFGMGAAKEFVNIWHWKSDWEGEHRDIEDVYPNMAVEHYQRRKDGKSGEPEQEKSKASHYDSTFITALGAGNPISALHPESSVEDLNAGGLGTLTSQKPAGQGVKGAGKWYKGIWRVSFSRQLRPKGKWDVKLSSGKSLNVGFALWNGSQGDRNGQKQVSIWHELVLE